MLLGNRRYLFVTLLTVGVLGISACQKADSNAVTDKNLVVANPKANKIIGDSENKFTVMGRTAVANRVREKTLYLAGTPQASAALQALSSLTLRGNVPGASADRLAEVADGSESLTVGFPAGLLGEQQVFGAVVTKVSDGKSEKMGQLKLSDLTPIHVRAVVAKGANDKYSLALVGCARDCKEGDEEQPLIALPILGVDETKKEVLVDLAAIGNELNLIELMDPQGSFTQLKTKSSATVAVDYSFSTLVFDIESKMVPLNSTGAAPETIFKARWYLKLTSVFNPAFKQRTATPGVGFFMTERSAEPKIQRWARPSADGTVKYYLKNIPAEWKKVFASSMDEWNEKFVAVTGKKLLAYEFLDATDPRHKLIVAGDIRYNVMEWDLDNVAPYGGFGPSIANQQTGELLSGNVLVQGPKIIEGYTKWFKAGTHAEELRAEGRVMEADKLLRDVAVELSSREDAMRTSKFEIRLGQDLAFSVKAQNPNLHDPVFARDDFELLPAGYTFEKYMEGYFRDIVEHEMGHNLGLRHNFRGNLSGKLNPTQPGEVSHSIMEYLGRGHRHLDKLGPYDVMAIKYGYAGILPEKTDMFCTDEDVASPVSPESSPECSRDDATMDPFKFFEGRLTRAIDLLTARATVEAPVWAVEDMDRELSSAITGLGLYAFTAADSGAKWTHFFTGGDRPATPSGVPDYVAKKIRAQVCDGGLQAVIEKKATAEAKELTRKNIQRLRAKVDSVLEPLGVDASCAE